MKGLKNVMEGRKERNGRKDVRKERDGRKEEREGGRKEGKKERT